MPRRKTRRQRSGASPPARVRQWCERRMAALRRAVASRLRPWRPAVEADAAGRHGRRLRRVVARVTRGHLRALGVAPPAHLLVVVQRTVTLEGRPLRALLEVFEDAAGQTRHVLYVALTAGGRRSSDEDVAATLRQQLRHVVAPELGSLRTVPLEAEPARAAAERPEPPGEPEAPGLDELLLPGGESAGANGALPAVAGRGE